MKIDDHALFGSYKKAINKEHNQKSMYLLNSSAADVGQQHDDEGDVDIFSFKQLSCYNKEQRMGRNVAAS